MNHDEPIDMEDNGIVLFQTSQEKECNSKGACAPSLKRQVVIPCNDERYNTVSLEFPVDVCIKSIEELSNQQFAVRNDRQDTVRYFLDSGESTKQERLPAKSPLVVDFRSATPGEYTHFKDVSVGLITQEKNNPTDFTQTSEFIRATAFVNRNCNNNPDAPFIFVPKTLLTMAYNAMFRLNRRMQFHQDSNMNHYVSCSVLQEALENSDFRDGGNFLFRRQTKTEIDFSIKLLFTVMDTNSYPTLTATFSHDDSVDLLTDEDDAHMSEEPTED